MSTNKKLIQKTMKVVPCSENRAQELVGLLLMYRLGLKPRESKVLPELDFLPEKQKEPQPYVVPIPRKWAPIEKITSILNVPSAFDTIKLDSVESIRERNGLI